MVSNDVEALGPGGSCEALLLTPKARVIAPLVVLRRGDDDFLLLTEPELGERVAPSSPLPLRGEGRDRVRGAHLDVVFGGEGIATADYGEPAAEVLDAELEPTARPHGARAAPHPGGHAGVGEELDDRVLPAEAGLTSGRSASRRGAIQARSPSRDCTIAAIRTGASAFSSWRRFALDAELSSTARASGGSRARSDRDGALRSPTCAAKYPRMLSSRPASTATSYTTA